jgi:L-histidine Nalpha-methyltransferase
LAGILHTEGIIHSITSYNSKLRVINAVDTTLPKTFAEEVNLGLLSNPKFLQPKYFYDSLGSYLFEKICSTEEYYVTRTETSILKKHSPDIAAKCRDKKVMVELGSGSAVKTKYVISSLIAQNKNLEYIPIDVSDILIPGSRNLIAEFENLKVSGIHAVYEDGLDIAGSLIKDPKLIIFLGSSIGNFSLSEAENFIRHIAGVMNNSDSLLIGFDLVKDIDVLNYAYNDSEGYTERFNLNILERINRELGGEFDTRKFRHRAFFNSIDSRIEMHLESLIEHDVCIHGIGKSIHFIARETIHTENSYKFTDEMINGLALHAGLKVTDTWKDNNNYFALCLMKKSG